jgi:hypothetical protein
MRRPAYSSRDRFEFWSLATIGFAATLGLLKLAFG